MLLTELSEAEVQRIEKAFADSPETGWQALTQHLGEGVGLSGCFNETPQTQRSFKPTTYRLASNALSWAASQFSLSLEAGHVCWFMDNFRLEAERSSAVTQMPDISLQRYKSDVLVHYYLLGDLPSVDAERLWNECTSNVEGTWKLDRLMEHRDYPNWAIKQRLQFVQLCTLSELAYLSGQLRESATIDLFLLAASGIGTKESVVVPAWYGELQQFKFMRLFERGLERAIDNMSAKTLAQMCDSSLAQGSARRLLLRFMDSFIRVDDLFPYEAGGCAAFKDLREARAEEKAAFEQCLNDLLDAVTPLDRFNTKPRKASLGFSNPNLAVVS